jgi:hypothetical protein
MSRRPTARLRTAIAAAYRPASLLLAAAFAASGLHAEPDPTRALELLPPGEFPGAFGSTVAVLDFNGDGKLDIAVADPSDTLPDGQGRGVVHIYYSTPFGWQVYNSFELRNAQIGFGLALAVGDFDGDGRDDLLIGAPHENSGGGSVNLIRHLNPTTTIMDGLILNGGPSGGRCGTSLVVGDFNGDGHLDFVTGCPEASFDGLTSVGRVQRGYGAGNGSFNYGFLSQQTAGVAGTAETGDRFGAALASGDFNCDGVDDLAVGAPGETVDGGERTGVVSVLYGASPGGLSGSGSQLLRQGTGGVPGVPGNGDGFGSSLAAADFDNGFIPCADLAIGIPDDAENPGGAVLVLSSAGPTGLTATGAELLTIADFIQQPSLVLGSRSPDPEGRLGARLGTASLGRGNAKDLLIGVEGWSNLFPGYTRSGLLCIAYANSSSVIGEGQRCINSTQVAPSRAEDRRFGLAFAVGELDGEAGPDLVIGSSGRNLAYLLPDSLFRNGFEGSDD